MLGVFLLASQRREGDRMSAKNPVSLWICQTCHVKCNAIQADVHQAMGHEVVKE